VKRESGNYFCLPNCIFEKGLIPRDFSVYCYLNRCSDRSRQCFPSRKTIAKHCHISIPTVDDALESLKENGYIDITHRHDSTNGNKLSNLYTILKI
jgi:DNA-binding MarR family transcriptional regulator